MQPSRVERAYPPPRSADPRRGSMSVRGQALGLLMLLLCPAQVSGRRGPGCNVEDVAGPGVPQGCRPCNGSYVSVHRGGSGPVGPGEVGLMMESPEFPPPLWFLSPALHFSLWSGRGVASGSYCFGLF